MSITRSPDTARGGPGTGSGPGRSRGGLRLAGFRVRLTIGAQLLAMLTVLASALILPDFAPRLPTAAYLAATAIEIGAELVTADRGFGRWPGLRWHHPLDA